MDATEIGAILVVAVSATTLVVAGYKVKQWLDRRRLPFCEMCGISYHAPREEVRQPCPHNTQGTTHYFPGITPEPEVGLAWIDVW